MITCDFEESLCVFENVKADEEFIKTDPYDPSHLGKSTHFILHLLNSTDNLVHTCLMQNGTCINFMHLSNHSCTVWKGVLWYGMIHTNVQLLLLLFQLSLTYIRSSDSIQNLLGILVISLTTSIFEKKTIIIFSTQPSGKIPPKSISNICIFVAKENNFKSYMDKDGT